MPGVKGKSGRKQSTKGYPQYLIRLRPDLQPAVERTHRLLWQHGPKVTQTEAFWAIIEAGCTAIRERLEGNAPPAPASLSLSKISEISGEDLSVPGYGFPEDEEERPGAQPASANPMNGQGTSASQPSAQPAIPLALEPAPKTAHPVDVPQASEAPTESPNGEVDVPPYDTSKYVLGKLCPRGHDYHGTGQSLRHLRRHVCLECDAEAARERRKAKRQRQPA